MTQVSCFFSEFLATAVLFIVFLALKDKQNGALANGLIPLALFIVFIGLGASLGMQTGHYTVYFDLKVMPSTQPETLDRACSLLWQATERPSSAITGTLQLFWAKGGISVPSLGVFYVCSSISVSFYSIPLLLSSDN